MNALWLMSVSYATTLDVPSRYASVAAALEAATPGDVIELASGVYSEALTVSIPVTIRGISGPVLGGGGAIAVVGGGSLVLEALVLDSSGGFGITADAPIALTDVAVVGASAPDPGDIDPANGKVEAFIAGNGTVVTLVGVTFEGLFRDTYLVELAGGTLFATDVTFSNNTGLGLVHVQGGDSVFGTRILAGCNSLLASPFLLDANTVQLGPLVLVQETDGTIGQIGSALLDLTSDDASVQHAVLGGTGSQIGVAHVGAALELSSSALFSLAAAVSTDNNAVYGGYNSFYAVADGVPDGLSLGAVTGDPLLYPFGGECSAVMVPAAESPLLNAGDPGESDRAGGPADIGATGGPESFVLDLDGDGFALDVDCDEYDPSTHQGCGEEPQQDLDGDGFPGPDDCDDTDARTFPGAVEVPYDGIDQDCDGADLDDVDQDGSAFPTDCDDQDSERSPGRTEVPYDGIDQDCDGADLDDVDQDGTPVSMDCDDADPATHPGAVEDAGPVDRDCDGYGDPAERFTARGCAVAPGGTGLGGLVAMLLAAGRRRSVSLVQAGPRSEK